MPRKKPLIPEKTDPVSIHDLPIDSQARELYQPKYGYVREWQLIVNAAQAAEMVKTWGKFTHVLTATDSGTGEIMVLKADKENPDAVPFVTDGRYMGGSVSIWVPLQKLNVKVPSDSQYRIAPFTRPLIEGGVIWVFNVMNKVVEKLKGETAAAAAAPGADKAGGSEAH